MPVIDTTKPQETDTSTTYAPLETDSYLMKITSAQVAESDYPDDRGEKPIECTIVFELPHPIPHPQSPEVEYRDRMFYRMKYFYGDLKSGGPSKFKHFIDTLLAEGKVGQEIRIAGETDDPKQGDLIGIYRQVMVEKYTIGQGKNAGKLGNKVLAVTAPKTNGHTPQPASQSFQAKPISLDDVDEADHKARYDYLAGVVTQIDGPDFTQDDLAEVAADFAAFTETDAWISRKFATRNTTLLRADIKAMWTVIQRREELRGKDLF